MVHNPILEALAKLDHDKDEHWTTDGAPRVDVVEALAEQKLTRADIHAAAPKFTRLNRDLSAPEFTPPKDENEEKREGDGSLTEPPDEESPAAKALAAKRAEQAADREAKAQRYVEVSERLGELHEKKGAIEVEMARLSREQAALQPFAPDPKEYNHKTDQAARMDFIESQKRLREQRAHRRRNLADLAAAGTPGVAPIDAAMSRKTRRGTQRPAYPQKQTG